MFKKSFLFFCSFIVFSFSLVGAKTLLYLPLQGDSEKSADFATINSLYSELIRNGYKGDVKISQDSTGKCASKDCAEKLGQGAGADEVVFTSLKRLGTKWIFSSTLFNLKENVAYNQRGTAENIEDLEPVTRRVSDALIAGKSTEQVASLDNITEKEETKEPTRRMSLFTSGFSLGYTYPTFNSYSYTAAPGGKNIQDYSALIRLGWLNSWEFRENLMLSFDAMMAPPIDFGGDINLQYLYNRTDITPFVGGGLGIHYINAKDDIGDQNKRYSGPSADIQGGMMFFRTYDIHLITRLQYQVILTSDVDNSLSAEVGVVFRPKEKAESHSGWGTYILYYLLGMTVLSLIGAAGH